MHRQPGAEDCLSPLSGQADTNLVQVPVLLVQLPVLSGSKFCWQKLLFSRKQCSLLIPPSRTEQGVWGFTSAKSTMRTPPPRLRWLIRPPVSSCVEKLELETHFTIDTLRWRMVKDDKWHCDIDIIGGGLFEVDGDKGDLKLMVW